MAVVDAAEIVSACADDRLPAEIRDRLPEEPALEDHGLERNGCSPSSKLIPKYRASRDSQATGRPYTPKDRPKCAGHKEIFCSAEEKHQAHVRQPSKRMHLLLAAMTRLLWKPNSGFRGIVHERPRAVTRMPKDLARS